MYLIHQFIGNLISSFSIRWWLSRD